jgi:uncharacterized hydrophobic protein (TIGR00271 family)
MLMQLRVFGAPDAMDRVLDAVSVLEGAHHLTRADTGTDAVVVTADLDPEAADAALDALHRLAVPPRDIWLLRVEGLQPGRRQRPGSAVVWADLLGQAGEHARPLGRYAVFMGVAGVIASYGVIYDNPILIVGAMAVSPDFLPIAAACIGLVARRGRLTGRALATLAAGLGVAGVAGALVTAVLDLVGLLPGGFTVGEKALSSLTTVNSSTFAVAFAAGIAGMLALETRASAAVGVAISVTTIPASAYLGVAVGVGEVGKAAGALAVLAINVAMLVSGGALTLVAQQALTRRAAAGAGGGSALSRAQRVR